MTCADSLPVQSFSLTLSAGVTTTRSHLAGPFPVTLPPRGPSSPALSPSPIDGPAAELRRGLHEHLLEELEISLRGLPHRRCPSLQIDRPS